MSLSSLLYAYLLGGVTLLPLLILAVVIPAWLALPHVENGGSKRDEILKDGGSIGDAKGIKPTENGQDAQFSSDGAASASFAVLRSYNLQSALTALNAKPAGPGTGPDGNGDGGAQESMSVYQSMYRSVFDRSKTAVQRNPLNESEETPSAASARLRGSTPPALVFYIVLRHGHLMLYDSASQMEVRHVISLAHHNVSLSDGDGDDDMITEADLFVKRTAILLRPLPSANHGQAQPKPFYLFSGTCSEKEDFYHSLLAAKTEHPTPQPIDPTCAIKLQSSLHSNSLTPETRAFNALIGRLFLAIHRTRFMETVIRRKIEKKITRVQKPAFIASLAVQNIDLGDAAPVVSNLRLKDMNISGDTTLSADVKYTGAFKITIAALAKLDLGPRFKVRTVDLVLAASLQRLQGKILVRVKPSPSNRIWFCFEEMPAMEVKVEPIVSSRQITYTFILKAIENRIREVVAETLVKPNWDDIPFFDTIGQTFRGGIWQRETELAEPPPRRESDGSEAESSKWPSAKEMLATKNGKTMSMPVLPRPQTGEGDDPATASGSQTPGQLDVPDSSNTDLKRRSVASLPSQTAQLAAERAASVPQPKPLRSPSFTLSSTAPSAPSVAIDDVSADAVRSDDIPRATTRRWIGRSPQHLSMRDAVDAVREVHHRTTLKEGPSGPGSPNTKAMDAVAEGTTEEDPAFLSTEPDELDIDDATRSRSYSDNEAYRNGSDSTFHLSEGTAPSTPSRASTMRSSASTASSNSAREQGSVKGKNLLAATAAATTAARQWAWNAAANRTKGGPIFRPRSSQGTSESAPQEPMGRGQPLPPPGTPLPGPQKGSLWAASGFGGSVKRKPVLPARRGQRPGGSANATASEANPSSSAESLAKASGEDEFGPWSENFGGDASTNEQTSGEASDASGLKQDSDEHESNVRKEHVPPPLPPRRKRAPTSERIHVDSQDFASPDSGTGNHFNHAAADQSLNASHLTIDHADHMISNRDHADRFDDDIEAIPAPVDPEAEQRGSLELEEGDGVHVIDAKDDTAEDGGHVVQQVDDQAPERNGSSA